MQAQNHVDLAARAFEAAVRVGEVDVRTWHLGDVAEVAAACLSVSLQLLDRDDEARHVLEEALSRRPESARLGRRLVELHIKRGRLDEALQAAGRLTLAPEDRGPIEERHPRGVPGGPAGLGRCVGPPAKGIP